MIRGLHGYLQMNAEQHLERQMATDLQIEECLPSCQASDVQRGRLVLPDGTLLR